MKNQIKLLLLPLILTVVASFNNVNSQNTVTSFQADKMNVLYVGVENPLTIICTEKFDSISISNGTIVPVNNKMSENNGKFIATITEIGEVRINIYLKGKVIDVGRFRGKQIPNPVACVGSIKHLQTVTKSFLQAQSDVLALMENFDFDVKFEVISFIFSYKVNLDYLSLSVTGNKFNQNIINSINKMEDGGKIYIEDIKAKGPDGTVRSLAPIVIILAKKE